MGIDVNDLPPAYQAQALKKWAEQERILGDYSPGRFAWVLKNPVMFSEPVPASGKQGWWNWGGDGGGLSEWGKFIRQRFERRA